MNMDRRSFIIRMALLAVGASALPVGAADGPELETPDSDHFLSDLGTLLGAGTPLDRAIASLREKYASDPALSALCLDLEGYLSAADGDVCEGLLAVFVRHHGCFSGAQNDRIRECITGRKLDEVVRLHDEIGTLLSEGGTKKEVAPNVAAMVFVGRSAGSYGCGVPSNVPALSVVGSGIFGVGLAVAGVRSMLAKKGEKAQEPDSGE